MMVSLKGARSMHSFARHLHKSAKKQSSTETKGLVLDSGLGHGLMVWFMDAFLFGGQLRKLRKTTINLAQLRPGEKVLDVGCGTGTLAMEAEKFVGEAGRVTGIDPGTEQIAYARAKAARRNLPADFQIGVIENLAFPDQTFDVVLSTLMMHHLPGSLKRQGLAEVARVLKPGGRLIVADFKPKKERQGRAARFHAGGSNMHDLVAIIKDAGFDQVETEEMLPSRFTAFPGAGFIIAQKR
jgi:SAM-dependent methyltransferase